MSLVQSYVLLHGIEIFYRRHMPSLTQTHLQSTLLSIHALFTPFLITTKNLTAFPSPSESSHPRFPPPFPKTQIFHSQPLPAPSPPNPQVQPSPAKATNTQDPQPFQAKAANATLPALIDDAASHSLQTAPVGEVLFEGVEGGVLTGVLLPFSRPI